MHGKSDLCPVCPRSVLRNLTLHHRIKVTTSSATVEGTVYTADPLTSLLILNTSSTGSTSNISPANLSAPAGAYRIIPLSQIQNFQILSPAPSAASDSTSNTTAPTHLDPTALNNRLNTAITAAHSTQARQGPKGTLPLEQALYDALSRTHPARWEGTDMVISDCFVIEKPYGSVNVGYYRGNEDSSGAGGAGGAQNGGFKGDLERFRKVVDMETSKATLRFGKGGLDKRLPERKGG